MKAMSRRIGLLAGILGSLFWTIPACASVSKIQIEVEDVINEVEELREPEITLEGTDCEITDIQWSKDSSRWKGGSKVTATLTLETENSFRTSYNSGNCRIIGANYSSSSRVDENTLKVRISYIPRVQLGETEEAGWSSSKERTAVWKKVPFATAYELLLYQNGDRIKTLTVTSNTADLSEYMTEEADYSYQVRAMGETDAERYYLLSGEYVESGDMTLEDLGLTDGEWKQYQEGQTYVKADGTIPRNQWEKISGDWYYFNQDGYAATDWQMIDGKWYYLGEDGSMRTGWVQGTPGIWYYLYEDGSMARSTVIDGKYIIDENGQWK